MVPCLVTLTDSAVQSIKWY